MFKLLILALLAIFILTIVRMMAGIVLRGFSDMLKTGGTGTAGAPPRPAAQPGGELKKDPVCGTFVPAANAVTKKVGGETLHFCSAACRDQYQG